MTCIQQHIDPSGMHRDLWPPTNRRTRTTRLARAPTRAVLVNTGDSLAKKPAPRLRINTSSCTRNEETKHHSTWIFDPRVFVTILWEPVWIVDIDLFMVDISFCNIAIGSLIIHPMNWLLLISQPSNLQFYIRKLSHKNQTAISPRPLTASLFCIRGNPITGQNTKKQQWNGSISHQTGKEKSSSRPPWKGTC